MHYFMQGSTVKLIGRVIEKCSVEYYIKFKITCRFPEIRDCESFSFIELLLDKYFFCNNLILYLQHFSMSPTRDTHSASVHNASVCTELTRTPNSPPFIGQEPWVTTVCGSRS